MLRSYTQNFTIKRTLTKTFAKLPNKKSLIVVTRFLVKNDETLVKKTFASPLLKHRQEEREKTTTTLAIAKLFALHANAKNK